MTKIEYRAACNNQATSWLEWCVENPSPHMTLSHRAIIRAILRIRARHS